MYNTVVRLCQFFCCGGKDYYDRKKKVVVVCLTGCAVVSVFGSGENRFWLYVHTTMYLEYHTVVLLCYFFWFWREIFFGVTYILSVQYSCAVVLLWRESFITTGKKSSSRLSGGCTIVITTGKKSSSCDRYYDRKK